MAVDVSLLDSTSITNINTNFQRVETALQDAVSRSGTVPNQMTADFDMNSNDILNAGEIDASTVRINGEVIVPDGVATIPPDSIGTPELQDGAVTAPKLATDSVTTIKIQDGAVTTSKVADGGITDVKVNTSSNLYNRIHDLPSVKDPDFAGGAVGDGITDDTAALQAALDSNQMCFLPPGTYRITSTLIADPTRNRGCGFIGLGAPSLYPDTSQASGPDWTLAGDEPVIWWDGADIADLSTTSATSVTIGTGSKSFTVATGKSFTAGMEITVRRTAALNTTYMYGTVTSYDTGTGALVVDVIGTLDSGTFSDWTIEVPTAVMAVKAGVPLTIEPTATFDTTPYGYRFHNLIFHGNEKAKYGFYSVRLQDGDLFNIIGYRCKADGLYINGSYSGSYQALLGYRNWGRGVSIGAADYDWGWTAQGAVNRVTFFDVWGYVNGRAGEYNEASTTDRLKGCGIFFGPHRAAAIIGWTAELNDGVGLVFAPTSVANVVYNGYTELNSSNDITGSGSAISTGRATEQRGVLFYGAAGGVSYGNTIDQLFMASEKLWLSGTEPSTGRKGVLIDNAHGNGTVSGWSNYIIGDGCDSTLVTTLNGQRPHSHGAWTPVIAGSTTAGTNTYSVNEGLYRVEGDYVDVWFTVIMTAKDAAMAGNVRITGLPFTSLAFPSANTKFTGEVSEFILAVAGRPVAFIQAGGSQIQFRKDTGTGDTNTTLVPADLSASSRLVGHIRYRFR